MSYKLIRPLAQSFFVEESCVLTSLDLFFATKDKNYPVNLHLRENVNGAPGKHVIPFSEVILTPSEVFTSSNGKTPTYVEFDSPIFVKPGEYSICIGSASDQYTVHISEIDQIDLLTGKKITTQPEIGVLFKSSNESTWSPLQSQDLKFAMYRAIFDTSAVANVDFTVNKNKSKNTLVLPKDPLEVFNGSNLLRVHHPFHNMQDGSFVELDGIIEAYSGIDGSIGSLYGVNFATLIATALEISNVTEDHYTVTMPSNANADARFGGSTVTAEQNIIIDAMYAITGKIEEAGTKVTEMYKASSQDYSMDSDYTILENGTNELPSRRIAASTSNETENLAGTESFQYRLQLTTDNALVAPLVDTQQLGVVAIQNLIDNPTYADMNPLASDIVTLFSGEAGVVVTQTSGSVGTIAIPLTYQSIAAALTPGQIVTLTGTLNIGQARIVAVSEDGSLLTVSMLSGDISTETDTYTLTYGKYFIAEEAATGGSVYSKYISRKIDFKNPSTSLNVRLDVNRQAGTNIELYYKVLNTGESEDIANKEYTKIDYAMPVTLAKEFKEIEVQLDDLTPFVSIVFKINFTSTSGTLVPKCRNLRLIALA